MVIEGDNLQVLASLRNRFSGEVDVVYIDPPYNLGKDDFLYSDRRFQDPDADSSDAVYVTNEDGGRHTKWLNFMAPRLYMLWEILNDTRGVIFVSINDVELFRLGLLMDEIFGEDNHVATIIWKGSTDNNPTRIAMEHEYILCYAKNMDRLPTVWKGRTSTAKELMLAAYEQAKRKEKKLEEVQKLYREFVRENRESLGDLVHYVHIDETGPYTGMRAVHNPGKEGYRYDVPHPKTKKPCKQPARGYRFPREKMMELINAKPSQIIFGKDHTQIVQLKVYLKNYTPSLKSVIADIDARTAQNELANLFGGNRDLFRNPKPVELIERLLEFTTQPTSLVLDAFAGSGGTAHAVMSLNQSDGGKRRFILVEEGRARNGKDKFCRTLTAARIAKAAKKHKYKDGFTFYTTGRKLDRRAIVGLERDALANLICQADETGRGKTVARLTGFKYIIGKNPRNEAICLIWNGESNSEVTPEHLKEASREVTDAGLKRPFRIYGTFCRVGDTPSWRFCQIPDEILAQMHIEEEVEEVV